MGSSRVHVLLTLLIICRDVVAVPGSRAESQHQGAPETDMTLPSELHPGGTLPLSTAPQAGSGAAQRAESGALARVHVVPRDRLAHAWRVFHITRLFAAVGASRGAVSVLQLMRKGPITLEVCLHRNESLPLGACEDFLWRPTVKGNWSASVSPFRDYWLDIRATGVVGNLMPVAKNAWADYSVNVTLTSSEEFQPHRALFLLAGLALVHFAPWLAACVPLYYGSAMTIGILAVVILILFQVMRFLPLGRKRAWTAFFLASLMGLGSYLYVAFYNYTAAAVEGIGAGEDWVFPALVFAGVGLALLGAGIGFWTVRRFVMGPEGRPDVATVAFVAVSLRVVGLVSLSQASADPVFGVLAVAMGLMVMSLPSLRTALRFLSFRTLKAKPSSGGRREEPPPPPATPSPSEPGPGVSEPQEWAEPERVFVSSAQKQQRSRLLTKEEFYELGQECTEQEMSNLVRSPGFIRWVQEHVDELRVVRSERREERSAADIQATSDMAARELFPGYDDEDDWQEGDDLDNDLED